MNHGQPPYGQNPWGQPQGAQGQQPGYNAYGYPQQNIPRQPQQPPMGQAYPGQGVNPQRPQVGYGPAQPQQPYAQTGYQQPVQPQMMPQMQPQQYQQGQFTQRAAGYGPQMGQQMPGQPQPSPVMPNPAGYGLPYGNQPMNQVVQPSAGQGYIGYKPPKPKKPVKIENVVLVLMCAVLPVLFILSMVLPGAQPLKWVFAALAAGSIALMWIRPVMENNVRLTLSLIGGVLAVVAMVSALAVGQGGAADPINGGNGGYPQAGASGNQAALTWTVTDTPAPTTSPAPQENTGGQAVKQLESFFFFWSSNNYDSMLSLVLPSWKRAYSKPDAELFGILVNRVPMEYEITNITGTDNDTSRTVSVRAKINKNNGRDPEVYLFSVVMTKEDDVWYVDPRSLKSNERETATPATENAMPTQPPQITSYPGMVCYYNPKGGASYHINPNCPSANEEFLPFKGSFSWEEVSSSDYAHLKACSICGAPLRGE